MCMFSRHVEHVAATHIFARGLPDGRQVLVYSMNVAVSEELAMILPLPVPADGPDDAVEFVDLEGYADFFAHLKRAFPDLEPPMLQAKSRGLAPELPRLAVQRVGAFDASFVPRARDFERLDPRFRLPPDVLAALPGYADWGFAVFQLRKPGWLRTRATVHPMAFRFPRRDPGAIFFPTTHVHDGTVPDTAVFDHTLYAQLPAVAAALESWPPSDGVLGAHLDGSLTSGLVDLDAPGSATSLFGPQPNRDVWIRPPAGVAIHDLSGAGPTYTYRVRATYHFATQSHHQYPRWLATAQQRLPALCAGLRDGLAELTAQNAVAWQLAPLADAVPPHFMNGDQLWRGTSWRDGAAQLVPGPGRIAFRPFSELVEPQDITLGFSELPSPDDARLINRTLCALLDRAVS